MSQRPISVVVPNYNGAATVRACVESIFDTMRHPNWELIVVDDGSTDRSIEVLQRIKGIKLIRQEHRGAARALNAGFAAAGRNDVVRVHSDVVIETPDWLNFFLETLTSQPKAGVVGGKLIFPDQRIYALGRNLIGGFGWHDRHCDRLAFAADSSKPGPIQEVDAVPGACAYYRREVIDATGGLDENYAPGWTDDDDFCVAARVRGYKVFVQPAVKAVHFARAWAPTSTLSFPDQLERVRRLTWEVKGNIRKIHAAYWEKKWGWHPAHPDLNEIRRLYGNTELCWRIGETMKFQPRQWPTTVDAVIVTWNNFPILRRCLDSLAQTDYPRDLFQVFVVDNASKDGTVENLRQLAATYPFRLHVIASPLNTGCPIGLNWGVMQGEGEIVARLDDDIVVPPNWLRDLVENFRRRPYAGCVGPKFINDDPIAAIQCTEFRHFPVIYGHEDEADAGQADYVARTGHIRGCCNLYRRDVFQRCDLFDLRYTPTQFDDPDHQIAVIGAGYEIIYDGRVRVVHKLTNGVARSHAAMANGTSNQQKMYGKWGMNIYEVIEKSIDLSREGRFLPDDGDTNAWLALGPQPNEFPRQTTASLTEAEKEFCATANRWLNLRGDDPQYVELIDDHVKLATVMRRDGYPRFALDVLHTATNIAPERADVLETLADTYRALGNDQISERLDGLVQRLTGKQKDVRSETTTPSSSPTVASSRVQKAYSEIGESAHAVVRAARPKLKVLMVNTYEARVAGGDMMQIKKTKEYLERLGCAVDIQCSPRPNPRGYDIVHLWNLWFPHQTIAQAKAVRAADSKVPIVLSTIYWDMSEKAWIEGVIPKLFYEARTEQDLATQLQLLAEDKLLAEGVKRSAPVEPNYPGYEAYQRQIVELVDALLPQSYAEIRNLRETLGVIRPFAIVRNSAEPRVFETATKDWFIEKYGVRDFVLTVGLVEARKNQLMLLYALRNTKVPVVVVGRNYDRNYMRLCRKFASPDTVFIDHMPHELLASAYKAARVHALPSWMECCAFVNVEAALSGCALAVSNKTSEPEYFGSDAYSCDPGDVKSIHDAVLKACDNHRRDEPKRARLRDKFLHEYTWERGAEQTLRTYQWALEKKPLADPGATVESHELSRNVYTEPLGPAITTTSSRRAGIVIPTFNRLELLRTCLGKLRENTPVDAAEVIVVDNGSTDGTKEFLQSEQAAGRLLAIVNDTNAGFARACNQGARAVTAPFVVFLNNDTEVQRGWLEPLLAVADADSNVAAVGSKLLFPDGTIQHAGILMADLKGRDPLIALHAFYKGDARLEGANQRRAYQALTAACLLVRKSAFDVVQGFDEEYYNGYEDVDLCVRFGERGWAAVYEPESVVVHHESQSGPERFKAAQQNIRRLHKKWLGKVAYDVVIEADGRTVEQDGNRVRPYWAPSAAPLTSIIILTHNQLEHTRRCVDSITARTPEPHELIFVDNGSTDGTLDYLRKLQASRKNVKLIANDTNRGFSAGNNQGLAVARGEFCLLLNNDVVVSSEWLARMQALFRRRPEVGLVGPMSNYVSGPQLVSDVSYKSSKEMNAFARQWASEHDCQSVGVARLVGFCLMLRQSVIEKIGGFDESFGSGNFEDDDFCIRANLAGFKARIAQDVFIHHVGNQTFKGAGIDYRQSGLRNWDLFRAKWRLPSEASLERGYPAPKCLPAGVELKVSLGPPAATVGTVGDGRSAEPETTPPSNVKAEVPPVAHLGNLVEARELLGRRDLAAAWNAIVAALKVRPFHPEAWLLLAQIALSVGDGVSARRCAQQARDLAPGWKAAKQFLKKPLPGNARPDWLIVPERTGDRLTVCIIAKDEERFLGPCLESVRDIANQIIVVDTGSTDRTVEIAKQHGAEVYSFPWCDDFSAARNAALEHATGDWILALDADEELPAAQHEALRADLKKPGAIAYRLPLTNRGREIEGQSFLPRLFRNVPGAHYFGRIHEQLYPRLVNFCHAWGLGIRLGTAQLLHHGYAKDVVRDRKKIERNLRMLRQEVPEHPDDPNLVMNLGLELTRSGDLSAGLENYREAFRLMSAQRPGDVSPELREALLTQFTCLLYKVRDYDEVVRVLHTPVAKTGGLTASLHFALGLAYHELKQYREAAEQMRQCLAKRHQPVLTPINTDILNSAPHRSLAMCLVQTGEAVEALKVLHQAVTENATDEVAWAMGGRLALQHPDFLEVARNWTGEAIKTTSNNLEIAAQRAEALMLSGKPNEALPLWRQVKKGGDARRDAAEILCAIVAGESPLSPPADSEANVSQEFLKWYRRLLNWGERPTLLRLNESVGVLRTALPGAAAALEAALAEAAQKASA